MLGPAKYTQLICVCQSFLTVEIGNSVWQYPVVGLVRNTYPNLPLADGYLLSCIGRMIVYAAYVIQQM